MEKNWQDFKILHSNINGARAEFENACETLFRKHYPSDNVQKVEVKKGDDGIDIFVGNYGIEPITVIQCKFFLDELKNSQHSQINLSFLKAINSTNYEVKEWILAIPRAFVIIEHEWWAKWKLKQECDFSLPETFIKLKNGNELIDLMKEYDLYNRIFKIDELNIIRDTNEKVSELHNLLKPDIKIKSNKKPKIYKDNVQCNHALWNLLGDKYEFNAETMSINFRGILVHSKHSKEDFSNLLGIETIEFDKYLNGERIPSLDVIFRLSKIAGLEMKFFFTPNFYGTDCLIQNEMIRYSILKNIMPEISISKIENVNIFIGKVLYKVADKIVFLHNFLINKDDSQNDYSEKFKGELAHQYYKLLELIPNYRYENNKDNDNRFTIKEQIIQIINPRIIIETIKEIKVSEKGEPILLTFFDDEIENKIIYGRKFDEEHLRMIFYDPKEI